MIRRWMVSCGAFLVGTSLAASAWSQSSSLAERMQRIRSGFSDDAEATTTTPPSAKSTAAAQGLPTILPGERGAKSPRHSLQEALSDTPAPSTARRSPGVRPIVDFDADVVRRELTAISPAPSGRPVDESTATSSSAADEFAAGLANGIAPRPSPTSAADQTPNTPMPDPISLPAVRKSIPRREVSAAPAPEPMIADSDDRYSQPSPSTGPVVESQAAAKAFQLDAESQPAKVPSTAETLPLAPRDSLTGSAADTRRESFATGERASTAGSNVLVTNQAPAITSDIRGPQQIAIGREATYRVRLQNQGGTAAETVVASVRIPAWAEVVTTTTTSGGVRELTADDSATTLEWQIPRLDAQAAETLSIELVPRESRPLEFGVTWSHDPVNARAVVEVQEPKLELAVSGPDDVLFGKSHVYRLTLSNPGTGVAERVCLSLLPPGGGQEAISTSEIGNLAPGATKTVEVELTAREAGKLSIQALATAEGDLKSEAKKELFCRKPELEVDWRGPEMQYAGTVATYFFRVRNPGTAAADDVTVRVRLPEGAEFVGASEGHLHDKGKREVAWRVGSLGPGDDCYMELQCKMITAGENKLAVVAATAGGDLTDESQATTNVVALADLTLDVSDPPGPVAVGDEAIYEIRVTNRGANAAEDVHVVGLFSAGIEPETVEGLPYTASDGRVAFRTIGKLPAGQSVVLSIRARATEAGTHVFRAEVLCRDLEIKLAAEETTRFYSNATSHEPHGEQMTIGARYEELVQ